MIALVSVPDEKIIHEPAFTASAILAVKYVKDGKADFIMKGILETSDIMRAILKKDSGLSTGRTMSMLTIAQIPKYHKLLFMSDAAIVNNPTLEQKRDIITNAVEVLHSLGYENPYVGIMAAVEHVNPKMPETMDAQALVEMWKAGTFGRCVVEGPISMDVALNKQKADTKQYNGIIPGEVDLLIWPNVVTGNLVGKALAEFAGSKVITEVVGAKIPLVITSRGTSAENKYMTILASAAGLV